MSHLEHIITVFIVSLEVDEREKPSHAQSIQRRNSADHQGDRSQLNTDASTTPLVGSSLTGGSRVGGTTLAELRPRPRKEIMLGYSFWSEAGVG